MNGDAVFIPGLIEIFFRFIWLIAIAAVFNNQKDKLNYNECHLVWMYYIGNLVFVSVGIFLSLIAIHISMKGSIMDMESRRHLPIFLYLKTGLALLEVGWNILGTYLASRKNGICDSKVETALTVYVILDWIYFVIIVIVIVVFFGLSQKLNLDKESYVKVWEDRCNCLFCCKSKNKNNRNALQEVAKIVAPFFENSDLVPTDIAAGLMLVQEKQEQEQEIRKNAEELMAASNSKDSETIEILENGTSNKLMSSEEIMQTITVTDSVISTVSLKDWMNLENIKYYLKFSMAMYGWPLYMLMNLSCGICHLVPHCRCCSCNHVPKGDNCCQCNMAAFYKLTEDIDIKILHVSFQNEVFQSPFIVSVDHKNSAVVVSIRGSLSLEDAITDMSAETGIAKTKHLEFQCHQGILQTAYYVKGILEEHSLLEKGFQDTENERIVVTGHSLGAGVAAILAILLKDKYDDVRCFSYAPPGGLLGCVSSEYSKTFIVSAFFGDDIIPRLSLRNIERLKYEITAFIKACPLPKYKIMANRLLCGNETSKFVRKMKDIIDAERPALQQEQLYPPGVVLYVTEEKNEYKRFGICSCSSETCSMKWLTPDQFQEILISSSMVSDHLPDSLNDALDRLDLTTTVV